MTDKNRPKERRLHPRYSVETPIDLGGGKEGAAVLKDLSMSGFACVSPIPFDEMAILEVNMELPGASGGLSFKAGGAVVRCDPDDEGKHLVAVFFTHMDETNRKVLENFLANQAASNR